MELRDLFVRRTIQKDFRIEEGHLMPDHIHILISIPPKYSVAHIVGFLEGETALMGYNEKVVRRYIQKQKKADKASDFADLFKAGYLISLHRLIQFEY